MHENITAGDRIIITEIHPPELGGYVGTLATVTSVVGEQMDSVTDLKQGEANGGTMETRRWFVTGEKVPDLIDASDLQVWTRTPHTYIRGESYIITGTVARDAPQRANVSMAGQEIVCDYDRGTLDGHHVVEGTATYRLHTAAPARPAVQPKDLVLVKRGDSWALRTVVRHEGVHVIVREGEVETAEATWVKAYWPEKFAPANSDLSVEEMRREVARLTDRLDRLQDVLASKADDRSWCGEFEEFCDRVGLESRRRTEHEYEVEVRLSYTISAYRMDTVMRETFGGDHDIQEYLDVTSNVTITVTSGQDPIEVDSEVLDGWLSDHGYEGYESAEITDSTIND